LGRQQIIAREQRWARPAAIASLLPLVLYVAGVLIEQSSGLDTGGGDADQLRSLHDNSGTLLVASIVRALGFLALPLPLLYLFRAAQARNPRVQGALVGFVFIGPVLLAGQGIVAWSAQDDVAADFAARPPLEERSYRQFQDEVARNPEAIQEVTVYTDSDKLAVEQRDGSFYAAAFPPKAENSVLDRLDKENIDNEEDSDGEPDDAVATSLIDDSGGYAFASSLLFPAILALIVALVYIPLQALRAGLLTRFFGTFGMALGASLILILPIALLAILIWTGYLGLLYIDRVPGGRPPAWDAGVAIPWPAPGEEPAEPPDSGGTEGEGSEAESAGAPTPGGQTSASRSRKRKRKRRR
jgi:hypothetical protein